MAWHHVQVAKCIHWLKAGLSGEWEHVQHIYRVHVTQGRSQDLEKGGAEQDKSSTWKNFEIDHAPCITWSDKHAHALTFRTGSCILSWRPLSDYLKNSKCWTKQNLGKQTVTNSNNNKNRNGVKSRGKECIYSIPSLYHKEGVYTFFMHGHEVQGLTTEGG